MTMPRGHALVVVGALVAFAAAVTLQAARDRAYPRDERDSERLLYVRSGAAMQRIALSYDALAADVYWIRAIQHYGGDRLNRSGARRYELLYPLLDLATTLDPYFNIAYRFGAIFLSEAQPGGPGRPDQAIALLRKGIAVRPHRWQYYYDTAFVYYFHLRDHAAAARWFRRAAEQPGAPNWLLPLAATMLTEGKHRASARFLWRQMQQSEEAWLQRLAARRLLQLDALDQIERLEAVVRRSASGIAHYSWPELVRRGILPGTPLDPARTAYDIDPLTGDISVSTRSPLSPMPDELRRLRR